MEFEKYMHLERFGTAEVEGIELGLCYIFPKIDGTSGSVWWNDGVQAGSRRRHLVYGEGDNAGFREWAEKDKNLLLLLGRNKMLRLFGEWLVPHSIRTYRHDAWRKFYVFDVFHHERECFLSYDEYKPILDQYGVEYIPTLCTIKNPSYENLIKEVENNHFLIQEGKGSGEGIVVKNYDFQNRFGRVCWAKIVTNSFKEKHAKEMGAPNKVVKQMIEQSIVDEFVTKHLVEKTYDKIRVENNGWKSKYIPRLLQTVFYDLVNEEAWNFVKKHRNPVINFKTLNTVCVMKIKELKPDLF